MGRIRILGVLIFIGIVLTGCVQISSIDSDGNELAMNDNNQVGIKDEEVPQHERTDSKNDANKVFKSLHEFDAYILDLKKQSDSIMKIIDNPGLSKKDIREAKEKHEVLLKIIQNMEIPKEIMKTEQGRYYANKYVKEELHRIIVLRNELLDCIDLSLNKMTKEIEFKIGCLQNGAIPAAISSFNYARENMLKEEKVN